MKVTRRGPEIGGAPKGTAVRQVVIGRGIRLYQGGTGYKQKGRTRLLPLYQQRRQLT